MSRIITIAFLFSSLLLVTPIDSTGLLAPGLCAEDAGTCEKEWEAQCERSDPPVIDRYWTE